LNLCNPSDGRAPDWANPPWGLLFPGLSEDRAKKILNLVEEAGLSYGGEIQSPSWHLSLGLDRVTTQWLRAALSDRESLVLDAAGLALESITPTEARQRLEGLIEDLDEFLETGDRYPVEDSG
jgi:hypothetical protein